MSKLNWKHRIQERQQLKQSEPMIEPQISILSSRFSTDTWTENEQYRNRRNIHGCIYGCPLRISSKIHVNTIAYVLEMNNTTNQIEGVGIIRNYPNFEQPPWIYTNNNYNRYIYQGDYRMDREAIMRYNTELVEAIENICFKGKTHLKRGAGLTLVPDKLLVPKKNDEEQTEDTNHDTKKVLTTNIRRDLQNVFRTHFRGIDNHEIQNKNNNCLARYS